MVRFKCRTGARQSAHWPLARSFRLQCRRGSNVIPVGLNAASEVQPEENGNRDQASAPEPTELHLSSEGWRVRTGELQSIEMPKDESKDAGSRYFRRN